MAQEQTKSNSMLYLTGTIAAYLTLNSTLNIMNKWLLGIYGFTFPLLLTTCHMLFSFFILLPFMLMPPFKALHVPTLRKQWKGVIGIGLFMAVNIAFNNLSLVSITLSLNQVIRYALFCCKIHLQSQMLCQVLHLCGACAGLLFLSCAAFWPFSLNTNTHPKKRSHLWFCYPLVS